MHFGVTNYFCPQNVTPTVRKQGDRRDGRSHLEGCREQDVAFFSKCTFVIIMFFGMFKLLFITLVCRRGRGRIRVCHGPCVEVRGELCGNLFSPPIFMWVLGIHLRSPSSPGKCLFSLGHLADQLGSFGKNSSIEVEALAKDDHEEMANLACYSLAHV